MDLSFTLPPRVLRILDKLHQAGFEAYIVGGCVRDLLLGRAPADWDITTSALPEQVRGLFRRTVATGLQHGTITVMDGPQSFEVTTYRSDGAYSDGRHPDSVRFVSSLKEDLARRDFTINAMAYHPEAGLQDYFGGQGDLEAGLIRAVGEAEERFHEDALRMMRAVRFSAQLGFEIEEETWEAIRPLAQRLNLVSHERIQLELNKLLLSAHPDYFEKLSQTGITAVIMPIFDEMLATPQHTPFHLYDVGHHTLEVMKAAPPTLVQRLCALLHDTGKVAARTTDENGRDHFKGHPALSAAIAREFLKEYRYDNKTTELVLRLISVHDLRVEPTLPMVRKLIYQVGPDLFPDYLDFILADNRGKGAPAYEEFDPRYRGTLAAYKEIKARQDPLGLKDLAVNGGDLKARGMAPGKAMGDVLQAMLLDVLEEPAHNNKEYLLSHFLTEERI